MFWWDIKKSLSYNCLYNFIIGNRGGGKTYGAKKYVIERFLKKKEQFIYLRRYKDETKKIKTFFDDINEEFPETEFKVKGKEFYINDELCGYCDVLSTARIMKSVSRPQVTTIIFDEFIIEKSTYHYLPNEVISFLEFYETVARMRDVKVYFLSNALTVTNPYFLYFNIKLPYKSKISAKNDILIELVQNEEYIKAKKETRFGKIIDKTEYARYSIENEFLLDNKEFIEKKSGNCEYMFTMKYNSKLFGVWRNWNEGKIWVSFDIMQTHYTYALTKNDLEPNLLLLRNLRYSPLFKQFLTAYEMGCVYYENMNIKNICYEIVKLAQIN